MATMLVLTDEDECIAINDRSGAPPELSREVVAWLERECRGPWSYDCDSVFNVVFRFEDEEDARHFAVRWGARCM